MENDEERQMPSERVPDNLRLIRQDRGLTLEQLSERLGQLGHPLRINVLSRLERGERRIDIDDISALAEALQVPMERLLRSERQELEAHAASAVLDWVRSRREMERHQLMIRDMKAMQALAAQQLRSIVTDHPDIADAVAAQIDATDFAEELRQAVEHDDGTYVKVIDHGINRQA